MKLVIATFFFIFCGLIWVISTTFTSPLHLYCHPLYSNYYPLNSEKSSRKLLRTISQESVNVSLNETLINFLQLKRAEKDGGRERKRKEDTIRYGCQWRNTSGGVAARSIAAMQQFGQIIKSSEQHWIGKCLYYLQNL